MIAKMLYPDDNDVGFFCESCGAWGECLGDDKLWEIIQEHTKAGKAWVSGDCWRPVGCLFVYLEERL